jgi:DNA polymerase III epsilon subunit
MEKLIALDIETTGLYPERGDRIVEIGAVPIVGREILLEHGFEALINPGIPISPEISRINGITDDMVRDAPTLETVLPDFLAFIGDQTIIAHNASFDVGFINHYLVASGAARLENRIIDTLVLSRKAFPNAHSHNLDALLHRLHIIYSHEQRHRSIGDAYLTGLAYLKLT